LETWTVLKVLNWAKDYFAQKNFPTPRLDAEVLLAEALGADRVSLYTNWERPLTEDERAKYRRLVKARAEGCPAAYLRGKKEFMSIEFRLTRDVPVPRPETEFVVEAALDATAKDEEFHAADIGTGSGNIAVAVAHFRPNARITAVDISAAALEVARKNAEAAGVADRVEFLEGDMLAPLEGKDFEGKLKLILSNPPYVTEDEFAALDPGIRDYEPKQAFLAGTDGLDAIRVLVRDAPRCLAPGGTLAFEIGATQARAVRALVEETAAFEDIRIIKDYSGNDRVITAKRPSR
jgi:release factor glutamine methyltransferase